MFILTSACVQVQLAYFGPAEIPSEFIGIAKPVAVTFPNDACTALSNKEHVNQKVVLISSGGICDNVEKVFHFLLMPCCSRVPCHK